MKVFVALCALAVLLPDANGLYFIMNRGDRRCFIEEVPEETIVQGKYKLEMLDPETQNFVERAELGIDVKIKNSEDEEIMNKFYKDSPGHFAFTSRVPGEHVICLHTSPGYPRGFQLRVHLDFLLGESANDYGEIKRKEKLDEIQLRLRQLTDQVDQISKEQQYQRVREMRFRETSESTGSRVLYWSAIQLCILL
eukprot:Ihof_evm8s346 gene=Ihof_evmTU8s346